LRCVLLGVSEIFRVCDELVAERHEQDRVLVGTAEELHVVFEQRLDNEFAGEIIQLRAAFILNERVHHFVNLSFAGLRHHLSDLFHNAYSVLGVLSESLTDLLVVLPRNVVGKSIFQNFRSSICGRR